MLQKSLHCPLKESKKHDFPICHFFFLYATRCLSMDTYKEHLFYLKIYHLQDVFSSAAARRPYI